MIYKNEHGFHTNMTIDGMDSAMRAGVIKTFGPKSDPPFGRVLISSYVLDGGLCVRCPKSNVESMNPWNLSRDQMMCLLAGLRAENSYLSIKKAREVFWACAKRGFFSQNFERDKPGSKKYLWPHVFYKDSKPDSTTVLKTFNWKKLSFDWYIPLFDDVEEVVHKNLDWADCMWLQISHMIVCAKFWYFYPFHLVGWSILLLQCLFNSKEIGSEQNQLQCMVKTAGTIFVYIYKKFNPNWKKQTYHYWEKRNEKEYADWIIKGMES